MISKLSALWLILLVLLPFTAPFPTCGFDDFFGHDASGPSAPATPVQSPSASLADGATSLLAPPLTTMANRLRLVALLMFNTAHPVANPPRHASGELSDAPAGSTGRLSVQAAVLRL
jgi:hypothetical protein